jgi:hypothetical protein
MKTPSQTVSLYFLRLCLCQTLIVALIVYKLTQISFLNQLRYLLKKYSIDDRVYYDLFSAYYVFNLIADIVLLGAMIWFILLSFEMRKYRISRRTETDDAGVAP